LKENEDAKVLLLYDDTSVSESVDGAAVVRALLLDASEESDGSENKSNAPSNGSVSLP
jgi:hypothetical protein